MPLQKHGLTHIEQEILDYLRTYPGSNKADIVRYLRDKQVASKMTVFQYLKDLENKSMIYGKKERPNSQSFMMYVNEENKLASVLAELEEFERAYVNLLEKSRKILNNKDYSEDAKKLGITETDPAKWTPSDMQRHLDYEKNMMSYDYESMKESQDEILDEKRRLKDLEKRLSVVDEQYEKIKTPHSEITSEEKARIISKIRSEVLKTKTEIEGGILSPTWKKELYKKKFYTSIYFLADAPIRIFHIFSEIMLLRTTMVWPKTVLDRGTLEDLYSAVYVKIAEIQIQLAEFLGQSRLGLILLNPDRYVTLIKKVSDVELRLINDITSYEKFGLQTDVKLILDSMVKLNEETKEVGFLDIAKIRLFASLYYEQYGEEEAQTLLKKADEFLSELQSV